MTINEITSELNKAKALLRTENFEDGAHADEIIYNMGAELTWDAGQLNYFACHFKKEPNWYGPQDIYLGIVSFDYDMQSNK